MGTTQSSVDDDQTKINGLPDITSLKKLEEVRFHLQDVEHVVKTEDVDPDTTLNVYLRNNLHMTGTKAMCREGGCGACIVVLQNKDPFTEKEVFLAVNSVRFGRTLSFSHSRQLSVPDSHLGMQRVAHLHHRGYRQSFERVPPCSTNSSEI
jgi:hypothetical protein